MIPYDSLITFFRTPDLDRISFFYGEVVGLEMVLDQGGCRIFRAARSAYLGFCRCDRPEPPGDTVVTLVTDDVDGVSRRLSEAGVPCEKEPGVTPRYAIYNSFFIDPDGRRLEVQRFLDPEWSRSGPS